jgi:hypothetical protein
MILHCYKGLPALMGSSSVQSSDTSNSVDKQASKDAGKYMVPHCPFKCPKQQDSGTFWSAVEGYEFLCQD